ncbi:hypothetical protein A0J61_11769 [Choanephora cucurbitarum]|uniref:Uncharacterized protein n=1 Tax=Choanephora cucurbitarum TaxID=101091 RepID=A0A1C7MTK9_9FUNG|nr:hypothetical protein A0J61_11769 [Choanephora cucurbitarum]
MFSARAEFTLKYDDGLQLLNNAQEEAMQTLSHQPTAMTILSTGMIVSCLVNMVNDYTTIHQSICHEADLIQQRRSLSSLAMMALYLVLMTGILGDVSLCM